MRGLLLKRRKGRRGKRERRWEEKQKIKGHCCLHESREKCPAKKPPQRGGRVLEGDSPGMTHPSQDPVGGDEGQRWVLVGACGGSW